MRRLCLAALWVLAAGGPVLPQERTFPVPPNVTVDGVPPIPAALVEAVAPYGQFRQARFVAWHPAQRQLVVATTFANAPAAAPGALPGRRADAADVLRRRRAGAPRRRVRTEGRVPRVPEGHGPWRRSEPVVPLRLRAWRLDAADRRQVAQWRTGLVAFGARRLRLHQARREESRSLRDEPRGSGERSPARAVRRCVGRARLGGRRESHPRRADRLVVRDLPVAGRFPRRREDPAHAQGRAAGSLAGRVVRARRPVGLCAWQLRR